MDEQIALNLIEKYFAGQASEGDYQTALDYFISNPQTRTRLGNFYQTLLTAPQITCEECQTELPGFLDLVTLRAMNWAEQERIISHLAVCEECAEEYLELKTFTGQ